MFGTIKHVSGDLEDLELESEADLPAVLIDLLEEIEADDPLKCYAGTRPPQRAYDQEIRGLELWAYSWASTHCGKRMYLKFALKKGCYIYVDCHEDRPET